MGLLGQAVKRLRSREGLTQGQLAAFAHVDRSYLSLIENGHVDSVGGDVLRRLAQRLNTTSDYLLGLTPNPWPPDNTAEPTSQLEYDLLEQFRQIRDPNDQRYALVQLEAFVRYSQNGHPPRIIGDEET